MLVLKNRARWRQRASQEHSAGGRGGQAKNTMMTQGWNYNPYWLMETRLWLQLQDHKV